MILFEDGGHPFGELLELLVMVVQSAVDASEELEGGSRKCWRGLGILNSIGVS